MDKIYDKHYVKRDPATQLIRVEDGKPVLGDIAKRGCPLADRHVRVLNRSWKNTGIFYAEVKKEESKSDARLALETEATTLSVGFNEKTTDDKLQENINKAKTKALRADLFIKANQLLADGKIEKAPAKTIKTEDLQKLINEAIEE